MTSNEAADNKLSAFSNLFFTSLAETITEACGYPWQVTQLRGSDEGEGGSEPVRMKFVIDGNLSGEVMVEFRRCDAVMMAAQILQQAAIEFEGEHAEAFLKMIETAANRFGGALVPEFGKLTIAASSISGESFEGADAVEKTLTDADNNHITIRMYFNSAISEVLFLRSQVENAISGSAVEATNDASGDKAAIAEAVNLSLVMDVELNVTLRFGQRQLALREILDLTTGSVVELDRQVEEPVELLLDGAVIARGEAVVVDGNYGLRVTEVSKPASRVIFR